MFKIIKLVMEKFQAVSTLLELKYALLCQRLGVSDTTQTRVFVAVVASVFLFYICWFLARLFSFFYSVSGLLLAIVNQ